MYAIRSYYGKHDPADRATPPLIGRRLELDQAVRSRRRDKARARRIVSALAQALQLLDRVRDLLAVDQCEDRAAEADLGRRGFVARLAEQGTRLLVVA